MSVLCYLFFSPLSLHLSLSSSLCVSRSCFCREHFSWRHCSVSTQAHTNHAGCCRGEAAAMCVCQSLLKDPRCSRAAMQFSSPASADIFPLLSLLPFFIPPPPTHLFLPHSLSLVSVLFHAVSNPQSLSFMPSTNTHVVLLLVCVRVKALSQRRVSHQCCCSQKKGILLFFAFLLLSRSSWTWEENLRGNVSVSHGAMLICVYVSGHVGFPCFFSLMCILLSRNSKIKHVSLFLLCVCEWKCLCWCVCVCLYGPLFAHWFAWMRVCVHRLVRGLPPWLRPSRTSRGRSRTDSMKSKVTWKLPYWRNISYVSIYTNNTTPGPHHSLKHNRKRSVIGCGDQMFAGGS